jgi:hypothetical protein
LILYTGLGRGAWMDPEQELKLTQQQLADRNQTIAKLHRQLDQAASGGEVKAHTRNAHAPVEAEDQSSKDSTRALYLDLMKRCLTNWIYVDTEEKPFDQQARAEGRDWPPTAHSMIGLKRLDNLQFCVEDVLTNQIPGDLIETGAWRGGATIFMRAILKAYGVENRYVWVADSFEGLPAADAKKYPHDAGDRHHIHKALRVSLDQVRTNFERYGLLDIQVRFLKGWFRDTLPGAPIEKLAVLRLDGDMYESTMDALVYLYPKLSIGGYLIVDDYAAVQACRQAVHDYRESHDISDEILPIDWSGIFWQRTE